MGAPMVSNLLLVVVVRKNWVWWLPILGVGEFVSMDFSDKTGGEFGR